MALVQVHTSGGEETQPDVTAAAAETSGTTPRRQVVAASFAAISVAWLLSITINAALKPPALVIPAGIGLFAMLYAVTQGLERLLEPITSFFFCTKTHTENRNATLAAAVNLQAATNDELPAKLTELAKAAKVFHVPVVLTSVAAKTFSGDIFPEIQAVFPDLQPIDRTSMNSWDDEKFRAAVERIGRKKLVIAALWTEVCLVMPVINALQAGYEIYAVADASGGTSVEAHNMAIQRCIQAGAVPVTWMQVLLEFQRDWARQETYLPVLKVAEAHGGAYGVGIGYAKSMLGPHASEAGGASQEASGRR